MYFRPSQLGFPGGSDGEESTCSVGDLGPILGWEDPVEKLGNLLQCSCLENPYGQRSLAGYTPQGLRVRHD